MEGLTAPTSIRRGVQIALPSRIRIMRVPLFRFRKLERNQDATAHLSRVKTRSNDTTCQNFSGLNQMVSGTWKLQQRCNDAWRQGRKGQNCQARSCLNKRFPGPPGDQPPRLGPPASGPPRCAPSGPRYAPVGSYWCGESRHPWLARSRRPDLMETGVQSLRAGESAAHPDRWHTSHAPRPTWRPSRTLPLRSLRRTTTRSSCTAHAWLSSCRSCATRTETALVKSLLLRSPASSLPRQPRPSPRPLPHPSGMP